jgi:hypothetical protein
LGPGGIPRSSDNIGVIASTAEGESAPATPNHALAKYDLPFAKTTGSVDGGSTQVFRASDTTVLNRCDERLDADVGKIGGTAESTAQDLAMLICNDCRGFGSPAIYTEIKRHGGGNSRRSRLER